MIHHTARQLVCALIALAAIAVSAPAHAGAAESFWVYGTTGGYLDSSPAIADLDGDGSPDICMTSLAGPVFALDAFGREMWKNDLRERISIAPTAADIAGDSGPELLVLTQAGKLYCLEGRSGDVWWVYDIPSRTRLDTVANYVTEYDGTEPIKHGGTTVVAVDMDSNGSVEIVTNTVTGTVFCLSATGDLLWTYDAGEELPTAPAVGDLDGDGTAEVIISSLEHPASCIAADGTLRWQYAADSTLGDIGRSKDIASPIVVDLNGDGRSEVITYDENTMVALDADGYVVWTTVASRSRVDAALTVADADRDGSPELYAVDLSGDVVRRPRRRARPSSTGCTPRLPRRRSRWTRPPDKGSGRRGRRRRR